jgi:two-component system, NarL family, nitrate/nitrite response regulator NarL
MLAPAGSISVMLVDDHQSVLWGLQKLIDGERPRMHVVDKASCSRDALCGAEKHKPDIVLLDLDLGGENGIALVSQLRECSGAKVLILTGLKSPEIREQAVVQGACGVVLKSDPAEVILNAIQRVHEGELWLDRGTAGRVFASLSRRARNGGNGRGQEAGSLTIGERRVVESVVRHKGAPNKVIANALHISSHTLRNHLASIYGKLGIHRRLDLVLYAMENGFDRGEDA